MNSVAVSTNIDIPGAAMDALAEVCRKVLRMMKKDAWELSVFICDDGYMQNLNKVYRKIDTPTDVLSFPQEDTFREHDKTYAGDVVISLDTAVRQAEENNISRDDEMKRLLIHGILHLTGMIHETDEEYNKMLKQQEDFIKLLDGEKIF